MNKLLLKTSVAISSLPVAAFALAGRVFADCRTEGCAATGFSCQQIGTSDQWGCFDSGNFQPTKGFFTSFETLWSRLLQFVMAIGLLMVFLYLIWGGIDWITSGGDKGKTEGARNKITAAVIGLIVLAAAYAILTIAVGFLGGGDFSSYLNSAGIN